MDSLFSELENDPESLFHQVKTRQADLRIEQIITAVCETVNINQMYIKKKGSRANKDKRVQLAKTIITSILRETLQMSLENIADVMGLADHSTIHYRLKRARKLYRTDKEFNKLYNQCIGRLHRELHPYVHKISSFMQLYHDAQMPRDLTYELHRIDNWLQAHGYKLGLQHLSKDKGKVELDNVKHKRIASKTS